MVKALSGGILQGKKSPSISHVLAGSPKTRVSSAANSDIACSW